MNERHVMIDRQQYEQQVAELCEARARLASLHDTTPVTLEWIASVWPDRSSPAMEFVDGPHVKMINDDAWALKQHNAYRCGMVSVHSRGEFRRAAELLGISLDEKGGV